MYFSILFTSLIPMNYTWENGVRKVSFFFFFFVGKGICPKMMLCALSSKTSNKNQVDICPSSHTTLL